LSEFLFRKWFFSLFVSSVYSLFFLFNIFRISLSICIFGLLVDCIVSLLCQCRPSFGLISVNALTAATEVLIPIQCEYYALEGLSQLLRNIELIQSNLNPQLKIEGVILTMFSGRTRLAKDVAGQVRDHFGQMAYDTVIPRTVRLAEAPSYGEPIELFDRRSRGALAYRYLAAEFRRRHGRS